MEVNLLDWFGYFATVVILISLMMSSIIKLRWINLIGSLMFATFGFMISSVPTTALNLGIVIIDAYYLYKLYNGKDEFNVVEAELDSKYFHYFLKKHSTEIKEQMDVLEFSSKEKAYYFVRNDNTAGLLMGRRLEEDVFFIDVDFVSKRYRDFKIGMHFLGESRIKRILSDYKELHAVAKTDHHEEYLKRVGFIKRPTDNVFVKKI